MTRTKLAFVGAKHPHVFPRLDLATGKYSDRCEVTGLYDPDPRTRAHVEQAYGVPVHDTLEPLLAGADAAVVEGYDHENPDLVRQTLPRVKALLVEKVGAPTVEAMRAMADFCAGHEAHVTVGYMLQRSPVMPRLREIIASGVLGPVTLARFHAATPTGCSAEIWQSLPEDLGGMFYTDGCHMVRTILDLLGTPAQVTGGIRKLPPGETVAADIFKPDALAGLGGEHEFRIGELLHEDVGAAILSYPDKLAVLDITAWEAHNWVEAWRIELYGANATLEAGLMPPWLRLHVRRPHPDYHAGVHEQRFTANASTGAAVSLVPDITYDNELRALLEAFERGSTDQSDLRAALQVVEVLHATFESSRRGTPVGVPATPGWQ